MKKAVVFLFLCVAAAPAAAQTLSLEECRAAAVEHNRTLRNSRLDLDAASQTHREAFTNYFPQISASGGLFQAQHGLVQADFAVPQMGTLPVSMVKRGIIGSRAVNRAQDGMVASNWVNNLETGRTWQFSKETEAAIEALTVEDVNKALRRFCDVSKLTFALAGDLAKAKAAGKDFTQP